MLAEVVRSGVVEAVHDGSVAVVRAGRLDAVSGDVDRPFFFRSAAKPFQATVAQELGARLPPEHLAVACASHDGDPAHLSIVGAMLRSAGLGEENLRCPPAWPLGERSRLRMAAEGHRRPRRIWHNCSGKHAAMLRASAAQGWDLASYTDRSHPLQLAISQLMSEITEGRSVHHGVDGCGVPCFSTSTASLASAFSYLSTDPRFGDVRIAMHRYPALVSGTGNADALVATATAGAAKRGAEGCLAIALPGGVGVAIKCWDGSPRPLGPAAVRVLEELDLLSTGMRDALESIASLPVLGGGDEVGTVRPVLRLRRP